MESCGKKRDLTDHQTVESEGEEREREKGEGKGRKEEGREG